MSLPPWKYVDPPLCPRCQQRTVVCLWAGTYGWLCAACGLFWRAVDVAREAGETHHHHHMIAFERVYE